MKSILYDLSGKKKSEIELPSTFSNIIREDIALKYFEAEKFWLRQAYSTYDEAGKRHSASGTISHMRHTWKGHYGKGISRLPRKTMSRRGTQFFWIGAEVSNTRGGRVAHPPVGIYANRKINQKEKIIALNSAFSATFSDSFIKRRYSSLNDSKDKINSAVIESIPEKTKLLIESVKNIFGNSSVLMKKREVRAGKGKSRGRKYKSSAGLLILTGKDEKVRGSVFDILPVKEVKMRDIYPLGRITLYTKKAIDEISEMEKTK